MDLQPHWIVGFVDGEGCFFVGINRQESLTLGYQVLPEFRVVQHERDKPVLFALKRFFGHGVVRRNHGDRYELRIRKLDGLQHVVRFFERHPLKTKKQVDFAKFAHVIRWMGKGRHLERDGLIRIIEIAMTMNRADKPGAQEILQRLREQSSQEG